MELQNISSPELDKLRKQINDIDQQILNLIAQRSEVVKSVGELKNKSKGFIYIPEREKQIFEKLKQMNSTELSDESVVAIFTEIISACRSLEKKLKIAYLGPEASFTNLAAIKVFGSSVVFHPQTSIDSIFCEVEKNFADYGVVPIENSTEGAVNYTLDKFMSSDLKIVAELELKIQQNLLSNEKNFQDITKIYSHPQSFGQCKNWLTVNCPNAELIEVASNSYAAKLAASEKNSAAIGPILAAKKYELNIIEESIDDIPNNTTRFLVIGKNINKSSGQDKTSVMFSPHEKVGALYTVLEYFYKNNINLTMIESRPNKKTQWRYVFFVDMEGYYQDENLQLAFDEIQKICLEFKILGSYPKKS